MNVIFLTIVGVKDLKERGIYTDLMRKFRDEGHKVVIVSPRERRYAQQTQLTDVDGVQILGVRTLNIFSTNIIEKGLGTLLIEGQYKRAIKKHVGHVKFDLILYSTPPITFTRVVKCLKRANPKALTYLLLKDIFPQNAVDIGMFSAGSLLNKDFRRKEKSLYKVSDYIGCMSPANVEYVLKHNPEIAPERVEVAPNSVELSVEGLGIGDSDKLSVRKKHGLPQDKPIFIYGGNLGRPQGIDFLIKCLDANKMRKDCLFVVIGKGTEYGKLAAWYEKNKNLNVILKERLPKTAYDELVRACDAGLIFLDHRFTIPNFPSRLLSYLENSMPVLCATDPHTDMGRIAERNGFGYWCESVKPEDFTALVDKMLASDMKQMGENGFEFLKKNYLVEHTYNPIVSHVR